MVTLLFMIVPADCAATKSVTGEEEFMMKYSDTKCKMVEPSRSGTLTTYTTL